MDSSNEHGEDDAETTRLSTALIGRGLLVDSNSSIDGVTEALYLLITASFGFLFNVIVIACLVTVRSRRRLGNIFVLHGCLLDAIKCVYCIPFATSLLQSMPPDSCALLGGSFVLVVTASGVNIVAMVCNEAYIFSEQSIGIDRRASFCCILFGLMIVYVTSVIIHLGPTIIGGDFNYNDMIGNCIFVYGTIKSYVVHAMWIAIMTLVLASAAYHLGIFHRHIQSGSTLRLTAILRTVVAARTSLQAAVGCRDELPSVVSGTSLKDAAARSKRLDKAMRNSLSRSRVLIIITALFVGCWYPLYLLTLVDPKFEQPSKLYKVLTFVAWSNSTINPLVFLLFDRSIASFKRIGCSLSRDSCVPASSTFRREQLQRSLSGRVLSESGARRLSSFSVSVYERVGCRLHNEGEYTTTLGRHNRQLDVNGVSLQHVGLSDHLPRNVFTGHRLSL